MTTILAFILFFNIQVIPPGTIKMNNIYVDQTEVLNIHWLEFLHHKKLELDSVAYQTLLPDSINNWYKHPAYRFKPVVLISYEQAVEYCKWRSDVVSKNLGQKITYRLPTPEEWREIASEQLSSNLKWVEQNYNHTLKETIRRQGEYVLMDRRGPQNQVCDLFSNVSEMTLQKGIALGANNIQLTNLRSNLTELITYERPHLYLGFRCVAEIN